MGQKIKENDAKVEFFQVVFDVCFFFIRKSLLFLGQNKNFHIHSICTCTQCIPVQANHAPVYPLATDGFKK